MAEGNTSLEDCDALTWSLGWTLEPSRSAARVASTSFMFMLVEVPDPVWKTSMGNSSSHSPARHLRGRRGDGCGHLLVDRLQPGVLERRGALDRGQGRDERPLDGHPRDGEVVDRPLRLGLPLGRRRHPHLPHGVVLDAEIDLVARHGGNVLQRRRGGQEAGRSTDRRGSSDFPPVAGVVCVANVGIAAKRDREAALIS